MRSRSASGSKRSASRIVGSFGSSTTPCSTSRTVLVPTALPRRSCTASVSMANEATRSSTASRIASATSSLSVDPSGSVTRTKGLPRFHRAAKPLVASASPDNPSSTRRPPAGLSPAATIAIGRRRTPPASMSPGPIVTSSASRPPESSVTETSIRLTCGRPVNAPLTVIDSGDGCQASVSCFTLSVNVDPANGRGGPAGKQRTYGVGDCFHRGS